MACGPRRGHNGSYCPLRSLFLATPMNTPIRLLLVDDHAVMRAGLANLLATVGDFAVVAQADDGLSALRVWRQHRPDVCLLDMTMHGIDGVETLQRLREMHPDARVLMLTSSDSATDLARALAAGANGYVTKNVSHQALFAAIRDVSRGGKPVSRETIIDASPTTSESCGLTPREVEVLGLLREGFTNAEIARLLGITTHTVKVHVAALITKLAVSDRTQAVARGFDLGLLTAKPQRA
jgi:two-component system nitrate/nitrite response regulator NarL